MNAPLDRDEIKTVVKKIIREAEVLALPRHAFAWHRRIVLGIDFSIEAAQKRAKDGSYDRLPGLKRSAEMVLYWIRSHQANNEAERESYMNIARGIHEGLTT